MNQLDSEGMPVIFYAVECRDLGNYNAGEGREKCMEIMIKAGAEVNAQYKQGYTLLMQAARRSFGHIVKMLTDAGADVNATDDGGSTALMQAVRAVFPSDEWEAPFKCVQSLLGAGAHVNVRDRQGRNALATYRKHGSNKTLIKLLLAAGEECPENEKKDTEDEEDESDDDFDGDLDDDDDDDDDDDKNVSIKDLLQPQVSLKHLCRSTIASHLLQRSPVNLFCRVGQLPLPSPVTSYLLYNVSLDENYDDVEYDT